MTVISIDPNKWRQNYAVLIGELEAVYPELLKLETVECGHWTAEWLGGAMRSNRHANKIDLFPCNGTDHLLVDAWAAWACEVSLENSAQWVVIEKPDFAKYPSNKSTRDLCDLSVVVGAMSVSCAPFCRTRITEPREWKGNTSKERTRAEVVSPFMATQSLDWPTVSELSDDLTDAVAIGLWWWGRLQNNRLGFEEHERARKPAPKGSDLAAKRKAKFARRMKRRSS